MSTTTATTPTTKIVTGKVRLSYAKIWEPESINEGEDKKYSTAILIPKTDTVTIEKIKAAIEAAKEQGKSKLAGANGKIPANLKTPLRDGDADKPDDEAYAGMYFLNASTRTRPGIVDKDLNAIMDRDEVYSGCYARVSINFYAYNANASKGIAAGLNNIMKVADGERLAGGSSAEDDFKGLSSDDDDLL